MSGNQADVVTRVGASLQTSRTRLDPTNDQFTHPPNGLYVINANGSKPRLVIGTHDFKNQPEWLA